LDYIKKNFYISDIEKDINNNIVSPKIFKLLVQLILKDKNVKVFYGDEKLKKIQVLIFFY